jgi:hypothetical protein
MNGHGSLAGATEAEMHPLANPDGDNLINSEEWEADTNPFDPLSTLELSLSREGGVDHLTFNGQHRIRYQLKVSEDFSSWDPYGAPIQFDESCQIEVQRSITGAPDTQIYILEFAPRQPVFPQGP